MTFNPKTTYDFFNLDPAKRPLILQAIESALQNPVSYSHPKYPGSVINPRVGKELRVAYTPFGQPTKRVFEFYYHGRYILEPSTGAVYEVALVGPMKSDFEDLW